MLNKYRLPMGAMTFVSDIATLYTELRAGRLTMVAGNATEYTELRSARLTMVAGNATDWQLARYVDLKVLRDDRKVFGFYQTCLMVKKDLIDNDPKLSPALAELYRQDQRTPIYMQSSTGAIVADHKKVADVAAEFLTQAGLK